MTQKLICFGKSRKHFGKGENAGYQQFLFFPKCFQRACFLRVIIGQDHVVKNSHLIIENQVLEELPKAPPPEPRQLTEAELKKLHDHEEGTLTELRLFLRDVINKLGRDRKFWIFAKPVDVEDVRFFSFSNYTL